MARRLAGRGVEARRAPREAVPLLFAVATAAVAVLVIVLVTGGFTIHTGPFWVRAHNWRAPLAIACAAYAAAFAIAGRGALADAASDAWPFVDRHALPLVIVIAAAIAATGVAYGTYSASGSDASGYISEARLLASARVSIDEPLARVVAWPDATGAFSPLGYRPGREAGTLVPTYPAGLPLVMAPFRLLGGELAPYFVVPFLGALAILATYAAGVRLHSRHAGVGAAILLATSPIFLFQLVQPMSDVAVTAWWLVALTFALTSLPNATVAAGAASGLAFLTRPNLAPMALVVLLAAINVPRGSGERRRRIGRILPFLAGIVPAVGAQLLMQWRLYGSPFASGYGSAAELFGVGNIGPNAIGYARRLVSGEAPTLAIAAAAAAACVAFRVGPDGAHRLKRPAALAVVAAAVVAVSYLPYGVFAEWSYLRFLLPAFPLLFILTGALLANALLRLPPPIRGAMLAFVLTAAASINVVRARDEQAFNLWRYDARYRDAGAYLRAALAPNVVLVTAQESGSATYYADLPVLRWDRIDVDLDSALAGLRAIGRWPVLLVEDWEAPQLAAKFPRSAIARADWMPRAEFGDDTRVFLYDPADRGVSRRWRADRVH